MNQLHEENIFDLDSVGSIPYFQAKIAAMTYGWCHNGPVTVCVTSHWSPFVTYSVYKKYLVIYRALVRWNIRETINCHAQNTTAVGPVVYLTGMHLLLVISM